ncbi:MAG: sigma-70 family RNA polymerase sigma factor, partial [Cyanobacteria bacterium P01_A01_bin.114]
MNSRQSLIEIFAAFIEFQSDRFARWVVDAKLRRSIEQCLAVSPEIGGSEIGSSETGHAETGSAETSSAEIRQAEAFWALYWYSLWQAQPDGLAGSHLSAYLQETCYWSAKKATRVMAQSQYRLSDCFQLAIAEIDKVLAGYNPSRGMSLKGYASFAYPSLIRDILRQRQEVDICTDWTLLRRSSKKRVTASLRQAGLSSAEIDRYQLAWRCYKSLCGTAEALRTRQLRTPDFEQRAAIATLYNTERQQLTDPGPPLTPETLEQWLTQCAKWIRAYTYPPLTSLNVPSGTQPTRDWLDELPNPHQESLLAELI